MKAIKTTLANSGPALYIKALIAGTISGGVTLLALLCLCCLFLLISGTIPHSYLIWITLILSAISTFISGYVTARITKQNGLIWGAVAGIIVFLIILISGFVVSGNGFSYLTILKLAVFLLSGAAGGIRGVNKKDKLHIK